MDVFKEKYRNFSLVNSVEGVFIEWFVKSYLNVNYLVNLLKGVDDKWIKYYNGKNVNVLLKEVLKKGVG